MKKEGKQHNEIVVLLYFILILFVLSLLFIFNTKEEPGRLKYGIAVYNGNDVFLSTIVSELEQLAKLAAEQIVKIDVSDGRGLQQEQNEQVERYITLGYDVLLVNLVDRTNASYLIDKAVEAGIPLIFFNREPVEEDILRDEGIYYVGSDAKESAILQGKIILDAYFSNPKLIDKNGDGQIDYFMLEGEAGHQDTIIRTEYSIKTLEDNGILMKKVAGFTANFDRSQAAALLERWLDGNSFDTIELIISNNDTMALGALDTLEKRQLPLVPIVGIDGVLEGLNAVDRGKMLGTSVSDSKLYAKELFQLAYLLAKGEVVSEQLTLDRERYIWIPWKSYVIGNNKRK